MSQEIHPYQGPSDGGVLGLAEPQTHPTEAASTVSLIGMLGRRWLMVLVLWLVPTGILLSWLWLQVKPACTATAQVQVEPIPDENGQNPPFFSAYLKVLEAYMARVGGAEEAEQRKKLEAIKDERRQLSAQLDRKRAENRKLAEEYGATTVSMFHVWREFNAQITLEAQLELEHKKLEII